MQVMESLHTVGLDIIGPLQETQQGHKYILTLTDYYTKWVEFFPLKIKTADTVCRGIRSFIYG